MIEWYGEKSELALMLHIRIIAYPGRIQLPSQQHRCNLLVGPPFHEHDRPSELAREILLEHREQLDVGIEK